MGEVEEFGSVFRRFLHEVVERAPDEGSEFGRRLSAHLGVDPMSCPMVARTFQTVEHPNLQVALDRYFADREVELCGVGGQHKRYMDLSLADLFASGGPRVGVGPVEYTELAVGPSDTMPCIAWGVAMVRDAVGPLVALIRGGSAQPHQPELHLEAMAPTRDAASAFLAAIERGMGEHNVYRSRVVSLGRSTRVGPFPTLGVTFHELPRVEASDVILPEGLLERIELHTIEFSRHAERLTASGRSLKRGLLLHGPPGTGKTHTIRYLTSRMPERTTLLVTGADLGLIDASFELARKTAPAMVVVEDVDLIAEERTMPFGAQGRFPLLFGLLNQLDGLPGDADVIAVLTTNRADLLEPALASRPGRIDLAVEIPMPDATSRRRLIELYAGGMDVDLTAIDAVVTRTDGVSASFIKELLRHAALLAAVARPGALHVTDVELRIALDSMLSDRDGVATALLGARRPATPAGPVTAHHVEASVQADAESG